MRHDQISVGGLWLANEDSLAGASSWDAALVHLGVTSLALRLEDHNTEYSGIPFGVVSLRALMSAPFLPKQGVEVILTDEAGSDPGRWFLAATWTKQPLNEASASSALEALRREVAAGLHPQVVARLAEMAQRLP